MNAETGLGRDCAEGEPADTRAEIGGAYPGFFSGAALDFGRHLDSVFHGARLAAWFGGGFMPVVEFAEERSQRGWAEVGLGLSVGFGGT
jgi:hypothetical protein